mmetsp:Transcript_48770/g.62593  ORF Transcript_48770/g.62593 Transcript_48770/m.62593 type:complete len:94 (+) Transcript_48770:59-340(+)
MASEVGEPSKWVKLISNEAHEFYVDRECAMISGFIKAKLTNGSVESKTNEIKFDEIKSSVLEKVIQYMYYKVRYGRGNQSPPEFQIEPEVYSL